MKNFTLFMLILSVTAIISCTEKKEEPVKINRQQDSTEIVSILNSGPKMFNEGKLDEYMSNFENSPDICSYGSKKDEVAIGYDKIREAMKIQIDFGLKYVNWNYHDIKINFHNDIAWITLYELSTMKYNDKNILVDGRFHALMRKNNGKWKFIYTSYQDFTGFDWINLGN